MSTSVPHGFRECPRPFCVILDSHLLHLYNATGLAKASSFQYMSDYPQNKRPERTRINKEIRVPEVRVLGPEGENFGVMDTLEAVAKAHSLGFDLIEVSPNAIPPVARITDYGKYQYEQSKKQRDIKSKAHTTETKVVQIKIGTGDHDLALKAKRISGWLGEGHRVKLDLFLAGRAKYMNEDFLKERLDRILILISEPYRIADPAKKSPKGLSLVLEKGK
ncbi:MAG: translation initiation factor IF-3 [Candidatus Yonathbacteria bacterium]|nr:translation initiation factor IF-3 [Candidatus Yonathbacteria bacterium]